MLNEQGSEKDRATKKETRGNESLKQNSEHFQAVNPTVSDDLRQILADLEGLSENEARKKIAVEPFYDNIQNEITQSKRGIWVTAYFLTKWKPALGHPAADIVMALQKAADRKTGETTSSLETIAKLAGISRSTLAVWLSPNPRPWQKKSTQQREQWQLLHKYWVKEIKRRYRQSRNEHGVSRVRQTTNRIRVTIDDPVHPDDLPKLYTLYAERMLQQQLSDSSKSLENKDFSYESSSRTHRNPKEIVPDKSPVDNSSYESSSRTHVGVQLSDPRVSLSYRSNNVTNVGVNSKKDSQPKPRAKLGQGLTPSEYSSRERKAFELGDKLKQMEGSRSTDDHKDLAFFKRVAFLMPTTRIDEALRATRDALDDRNLKKNPTAYFTGVILNMAQEDNINLGLSDKQEQIAHTDQATAPKTITPSKPKDTNSTQQISHEDFAKLRESLEDKDST